MWVGKGSLAKDFAIAYELLEYGEAGSHVGPFGKVTDWIISLEVCLKHPSEEFFNETQRKWQTIPEEWREKISKMLPRRLEDEIEPKRFPVLELLAEVRRKKKK